ncbi:MAG: hypothetical protein HQK57_08130 [Deltaproteobacteria bacterium]|nr:hypothetical protein [Deltaproteobacteria bacterium]
MTGHQNDPYSFPELDLEKCQKGVQQWRKWFAPLDFEKVSLYRHRLDGLSQIECDMAPKFLILFHIIEPWATRVKGIRASARSYGVLKKLSKYNPENCDIKDDQIEVTKHKIILFVRFIYEEHVPERWYYLSVMNGAFVPTWSEQQKESRLKDVFREWRLGVILPEDQIPNEANQGELHWEFWADKEIIQFETASEKEPTPNLNHKGIAPDILDIIDRAMPEVEQLYSAIKDVGLKSLDAKRFQKAALSEFSLNPDRFQMVKKDMLKNQELFRLALRYFKWVSENLASRRSDKLWWLGS